MADAEEAPDARFSLANERTYLAWTRTSLALIAGGIAAGKALNWNHEAFRWLVAAPPVLLGSVLALEAVYRWRMVEDAMQQGRSLPVGRGLKIIGITIAVYAIVALTATVLD